jgi:hypothetical protein
MERRIADYLSARHTSLSSSSELWDAFQLAIDCKCDWALALLNDWAEGVGRAWANLLNQIRPLQAIVYMGTTAEALLQIPRVRERMRETMQRICMYPEHRRADFPILPAQEEHRAIYGAVIVYENVLAHEAEAKNSDGLRYSHFSSDCPDNHVAGGVVPASFGP